MLRIINIFILSFLLTLLNINFTYALDDYSGEIIPLIKPENMIINMGPCLIHDSIRAEFLIKNTGLKGLYIEPLYPSYYLGATPDDPDNFNSFKRVTDIPRTFPVNTTDTLIIQFNSDIFPKPPGWQKALLGLAFLKDDAREDPIISKIDTFFLKVKKTSKFFDGFDDNINFDSVYVNPTNMKTVEWRGRNVYSDSIKILNREIKYITQPNTSESEFIFDSNIVNLAVISDGIVRWTSSYYPGDMGIDSLQMIVNFQPKPNIRPDSLDSINVMVLGTGVKQKLEILGALDFDRDTILVAKIRSGDTSHCVFL